MSHQQISLRYVYKKQKKADIIHIHGKFEMVFRLRRRFGVSKKIILEYLGTDIRGLDKPKEVSNRTLFGISYGWKYYQEIPWPGVIQ